MHSADEYSAAATAERARVLPCQAYEQMALPARGSIAGSSNHGRKLQEQNAYYRRIQQNYEPVPERVTLTSDRHPHVSAANADFSHEDRLDQTNACQSGKCQTNDQYGVCYPHF